LRLAEVGDDEHDDDVTGSSNMAASRMRNEKCGLQEIRNYMNSSVIVDLAMGQIPCSKERISSVISPGFYSDGNVTQ